MNPLNPYAAPQSGLPPAEAGPPAADVPPGVWRSEGLLIVRKGAELPSRCVACNRPTLNRWPMTFYWAHPALRVLLFLNFVVYAIVLLAVRKKADLSVPLCDEHDEERKTQAHHSRLLGIGGAFLLVVSLMALGDNLAFGLLVGLALLALIAAAFVRSNSLPLQPKKIDDDHAFLKKAGDDFLSTLPSAPMDIGI
jgi:hypothetical protein